MSETTTQSLAMVITGITGCTEFLGSFYEHLLPNVNEGMIQCENNEESLVFKTARPSDFWVGQEIHVDITFRPRESQK